MASLVPVGSLSYASARAGSSLSTRVQAQVVTLPRFSGLKATSLGPDSFSLGKLAVCPCVAQGCDSKFVPFKTNAAYKVAVLGAGIQRGLFVSVFLSRVPSVSILNLYDETRQTLPDNLSHESTRVVGYRGASELRDCLTDVDVVVILPGVPKWGEDVFSINAPVVKGLVESVADYSPDAFVVIYSDVVNSVVPLAAEVMKAKGAYDPRKMFGVTRMDVAMANTMVGEVAQTNDVDVPVVGGREERTSFPLLSKAKPFLNMSEREMEKLAVRIQEANSLNTLMMYGGAGFRTMATDAQAVGEFVRSLVHALEGQENVCETAFVASSVTDLPFFASRFKLGKNGIVEVIGSDLHGLATYEEKALEAVKAKVKAHIEKGIAFAAE